MRLVDIGFYLFLAFAGSFAIASLWHDCRDCIRIWKELANGETGPRI